MIRRWLLFVLGCGLLFAAPLMAQGTSAGSGAKPMPKPVPVSRLVGFLKGRSDERRAEALAALDAVAVQQPTVAAALKESIERDARTQRVSPLTLQSMRRLGFSSRDEDAQFLVKWTNADDVPLAFTAAVALSERKQPEFLPAIVRLAQRKEFGQSFVLRRMLVDAVADVPDKGAIDFLVQMAAKYDGELRFQVAQHLSRLTGQNFGGYADQWAAWWTEQAENFDPKAPRPAVVANPSSSAVPRLPWPEPVPEFFGVPIYAKRVVFVIDRSRSMASSVDGITRLKEAVEQLEHAIEKLDRYAYFNVLAYHSDVLPFMSQLVQAEDLHKRAARSFAERLTPDKKTACYDALYLGLKADPNLEAMYFLSDGEPTTGRIVEMPAIVNAITAQNATQRTSIYTLGIDARGAHEEFLRELARRNDGQFVMIR